MSGLLPIAGVGLVVASFVSLGPPTRIRLPGTAPDGHGRRAPRWFEQRALPADLTPVDRWWRLALGSTACAAGLGLSAAGVIGAVVGGGVAVSAIGVALHLSRGRSERRLALSVPAALDAIARSCRGGSSVVGALAALRADDGPAADVLSSVARRIERGVALRAALDDVVVRHPAPSLRLAAAALLVATETGGAPARAVEGVAETLRDRAALDKEVAAQATQARSSAVVLVLAPVAFTVVATATDRRVGGFLVSGRLGLLCLVGGVGLDLLGGWWMARLVRGVR